MINLTSNELRMVSGGDLLVTFKMSTEGVSQSCVDAFLSLVNSDSPYDSALNFLSTCTVVDLLMLDLHDENSELVKVEIA